MAKSSKSEKKARSIGILTAGGDCPGLNAVIRSATLAAGVVGIELLLIIFIAPSFTSGAITGERERQTYDLLRTTLLATPSFITGKLESSLGYILLLLLAAIPLPDPDQVWV